jgi:transposase
MNMELPTILSSTLGLFAPWTITDALLSREEKQLDIMIDYMDNKVISCPRCGAAGNHCHTKSETWHHGSFLNYSTYLHARVPHVECCGSAIPVERPWSRPGSKFALVC